MLNVHSFWTSSNGCCKKVFLLLGGFTLTSDVKWTPMVDVESLRFQLARTSSHLFLFFFGQFSNLPRGPICLLAAHQFASMA